MFVTIAAADIARTVTPIVGLTVAAYAFGRWRERMFTTERIVVADIARLREEIKQNVARLERRLAAIESHVAAGVEQRVAFERRDSRMEAVLESLDARLGRIESRLEQSPALEAA